MDLLAAHIHNLDKSLPNSFTNKIDSHAPRMVANALEERLPELLIPNDVLMVNAKHLRTKVDRTLADIHELVRLVSHVVNLMDASVVVEGEKESQSQPDNITDDT
ncbi:hypothetical protein Tco_0299045 [Tanacetum coccineum]